MNKDDFTIFYFISFVSFPFPSSILLKRFSHMNTGFIYPSWTHPSPHTGYISVQSVQGTQSTLVSRVFLICVTSVKRTMWEISKQQSIMLCHTVINWITSQHKIIVWNILAMHIASTVNLAMFLCAISVVLNISLTVSEVFFLGNVTFWMNNQIIQESDSNISVPFILSKVRLYFAYLLSCKESNQMLKTVTKSHLSIIQK